MTRSVHLPESNTPTYDWLDWEHVRAYVDKTWDPRNCPHHSIIGLTGSGKSYLGVNGILSVCAADRVLLVDTKQDSADDVLSATGRPVTEVPKNPWYTGIGRSKNDPRAFWYRLMVSDNRATARAQVATALDRVYRDGNWVVYIDELFDVTGIRPPHLNLGPYVERIYRKGRSRCVSLIAATQSPRDVPTSFYDQASFAWLGRIRDKERQKRLLEIGGMDITALAYVASLRRRQWLLAGDNGEFFARTQVKV